MNVDFTPDNIQKMCPDWRSDPDSVMFLFFGRSMLVYGNTPECPVPTAAQINGLNIMSPLKIGTIDGHACYTGVFSTPPELPPTLSFQELRGTLHAASEAVQTAASRGRELLFWRSSHKYCGTCGARLIESEKDISMVCPECGTHYFPQIAPAVIVVIKDGSRILLAHNRNFRDGMYSLIAGFVESGESLEQAVHREILEETAVHVKNIRYYGSQPWPYPNSLMVGFVADYDSGTACADGTELEKLGWFTADKLPMLPLPGSIARKMIDDWKEGLI